MITKEQLSKILPNCKFPLEWAELLSEQFIKKDFSRENVAMFIAQVGHESAQLNVTEENLNYSERALNSLFKKYFPDNLAKDYARQPEKIANRIYANRMGNGNEASGDGWKYRGGGLIQLTGKNNYKNFSKFHYYDMSILEKEPELVRADKSLALASAFWFWETNNLNSYSDVEVVTKKINGGLNGLDDRIHLYHVALDTLT